MFLVSSVAPPDRCEANLAILLQHALQITGMIAAMPAVPRTFLHRISVLTMMLLAVPAQAGMPYPPTLTDIAQLRVEAISFFLFILLVCAGLIQLLWNRLRTTFLRLPRLSYPKALGLVVLWGLLFIIVLAMISGARELMTPGAWEKQGATYRLTGEAK